MPAETWKLVIGYETTYMVSDLGRISRLGTAKARVLCAGSQGYLLVSLSQGGKQVNYNVHVLVAAAFLGPRPEGFDVCHKNGDRLDNRLDNLEYAPRKKNIRDKAFHGTMARGERVGSAKLTEDQVREIRSAYNRGAVQEELAAKYEVSRTTIGSITRGETWQAISGELPLRRRRGNARLSEADAVAIREACATGKSHVALAAEYDLDRSSVSDLVRGKTWKHVGGPRATCKMLGEANPNASVTDDQVREIRKCHAEGERIPSLAKRFGVSSDVIGGVTRRRTWKHVS